MKYNTVTLAFLFLSGVIAQPHKHQRIHKKRDVVWTTEWDIVTETLSITTTIWVDGDATPVPPTSTTSTSTSTSVTPAEFHESATPSPQVSSTSTSVAPYVPPPPSTSSVYVQPAAPTSTYVVPVVDSVISPAYVAPTTTEVAYVAPTTPATTEAAHVAPQTIVSAPLQAPTDPSSASSGSSSGSSSGGICSSGSPCSGDLTYYTAGLGACGWTTDGSADMVIALPHELMGTQSNGNPYCGKMVTITHNGNTITAKVVDKCMGCDGDSIDLSDLAFSNLKIDFNQGRTQGTWYFND